RSLQKNIEDRLSEEMLKGTVKEGQRVTVDYQNGDFVISSDAKESVTAK
ncbi:hypothetical protein ABEU78_07160, partial [Heyndrickxia ginsengihumi]